jgi:hypothetical protein
MKKKFLILTLAVLGFSNYAAAVITAETTQTGTFSVTSSDTLTIGNNVNISVKVGDDEVQSGIGYELTMGNTYTTDRNINIKLDENMPDNIFLGVNSYAQGSNPSSSYTTLNATTAQTIVNVPYSSSKYNANFSFQLSALADANAQTFTRKLVYTVETQ